MECNFVWTKLHDTMFNYHLITKRLLHLVLYLKHKWCDKERKYCDLKKKWCDLEHEWRHLEQMWFRAKNSVIREYIILLIANQIPGITSDFKMDIIKPQIALSDISLFADYRLFMLWDVNNVFREILLPSTSLFFWCVCTILRTMHYHLFTL